MGGGIRISASRMHWGGIVSWGVSWITTRSIRSHMFDVRKRPGKNEMEGRREPGMERMRGLRGRESEGMTG
jgi:hypothetical protein